MRPARINRSLLPIKVHYFFFMAAMGPILPYLSVYGRHLGTSVLVMGCINGILPLLCLIGKPTIGFIVDYFQRKRKLIFIGLLSTCGACFAILYFLPAPTGPFVLDANFSNVTYSSVPTCLEANVKVTNSCIDDGTLTNCVWMCNDYPDEVRNSIYFYATRHASIKQNASCIVNPSDSGRNPGSRSCNIQCDKADNEYTCFYKSITFWGFVILMAMGTIGFNVCQSISDAICFDVLGEGEEMQYGKQRVWGSVGYGITAWAAGYAIDMWAEKDLITSYTPSFILVIAFMSVDLLCCRKLKLPVIPGSENIFQDVYNLLKVKPIALFFFFATMNGVLENIILNYSFLHFESLAEQTDWMDEIKKIEGWITLVQTLGGEVIFFSFSGKILKTLGYGYTFTFCFFCYSLRLFLLSSVPNPWYAVPIEFFLQGPTYALTYTTVAAYASVIAPPGTSATLQGIAAGMDDGLGFALGSFLGGVLFHYFQGIVTLRVFSGAAFVTGLTYLIVHLTYLKSMMPETRTTKTMAWKNPKEAAESCDKPEEMSG